MTEIRQGLRQAGVADIIGPQFRSLLEDQQKAAKVNHLLYSGAYHA
jgi:hypothetical protein